MNPPTTTSARTLGAGKRPPSEPSTPGLLVARELAIAAWLDRLAGASVDQSRRRFGLGRTQAYRRLQVLTDYGLICRRHLTLPPLYATPTRSLRLASVAHALAVSELVVGLELPGRRVVTELELRRERARQPRSQPMAASRIDRSRRSAAATASSTRSRYLLAAGSAPMRSSFLARGARGARASSPPTPSPAMSASAGSRPTLNWQRFWIARSKRAAFTGSWR